MTKIHTCPTVCEDPNCKWTCHEEHKAEQYREHNSDRCARKHSLTRLKAELPEGPTLVDRLMCVLLADYYSYGHQDPTEEERQIARELAEDIIEELTEDLSPVSMLLRAELAEARKEIERLRTTGGNDPIESGPEAALGEVEEKLKRAEREIDGLQRHMDELYRELVETERISRQMREHHEKHCFLQPPDSPFTPRPEVCRVCHILYPEAKEA